jgi:hypothetical protein
MKKDFDKELEILKKSNWNLGKRKLNKLNKNSIECLTSKLGQVDDRQLGLEDKVHELEHSVNNNKNKWGHTNRAFNTSIMPLKHQNYESWA